MDQHDTQQPCFLMRLPLEILTQVLHDDTFDHVKLAFKKRLRLINKTFAVVLAPTVLKRTKIDTDWLWPDLDRRTAWYMRYTNPKFPPIHSGNHRIQQCNLYMGRQWFDESCLLTWAQDDQNAAELAYIFERLAHLKVYRSRWIGRDMKAGAADKSYNFFLKVLKKVERLDLDFIVRIDTFSKCVEGVKWPNLRHLELQEVVTTVNCLLTFFSTFLRPLEVLKLERIFINPPAWPTIFATLQKEHNLSRLELCLWSRIVASNDRDTALLFKKQVEDAFGSRALLQMRHFDDAEVADFLVWQEDHTQPPTEEEAHRCKKRPTSAEEGRSQECGEWSVI